MPHVIYIAHDGTQRQVCVEIGTTVMEGAVKNAVPGIVAECGGAMACGTCQVYVDAVWRDKVGEPAPNEHNMLEYIDRLEPGSRLACQILIREDLDGLTVRTPVEQHRS